MYYNKAKLFEGQKAPDFITITTEGELRLASLEGKWIVLSFYPKDLTPGCTIEAKEFSGLIDKFEELNAKVIGVSRDNLSLHEKFIDLECIKFPLVSDIDGELSKLYGAFTEKSLFGKKYFNIERTTFLIDPKGVIRRIWRKVSPNGHAGKVLGVLKVFSMLKQK